MSIGLCDIGVRIDKQAKGRIQGMCYVTEVTLQSRKQECPVQSVVLGQLIIHDLEGKKEREN